MRERTLWLTWQCAMFLGSLMIASSFLFGALAAAQDAPPASVSDSVSAALIDLLSKIPGGKWFLILPAAAYLVMLVVRKWGPGVVAKLPPNTVLYKILWWLVASTWGGFTLHLIVQAAGGLCVAVAAGTPVNAALIFTLLSTAINELVQKFHSDLKPEPVVIPPPDAGTPPAGSMIGRTR